MNSSRRPRSAAGLTLVEVVAGLALLATILSSLLYARVRFSRNLASADAHLRAVAAADRLLSEWDQSGKPAPPDASGDVAGEPQMRWQTQTIPNDEARKARSRVIRLMIRRGDAPPTAPPLASVDVLQQVKKGRNDR